MIQSSSHPTEAAKAAFAEVAARFPRLEIIELADKHVEILINIPAQAGLRHPVCLALQNEDELRFSVGNFWCEWFPCTHAAKVNEYLDAVCGFLNGTYRVLEHYRAADCFKAELQRPRGDSWDTVATWSKLRLPSLRKVTYMEVTNG